MVNFLEYAIGGVPQGAVFALMAVGLVLVYKTTGVFNLAFGAQAYLSAAVFYVLTAPEKGYGWPVWLAFLVSVVILAPLFGLFLDVAIFRRLRTAPWQVKLVSALGFVIAIPELVKLNPDTFPGPIAAVLNKIPIFVGPQAPDVRIGLIPQGYKRVDSIGGLNISGFGISRDELAAIIVAVVVVVLLALMFRVTAVGLQMRALVESPRMLELAGVSSDRVSAIAWMLSSFLAGLAGVLLAPQWTKLDPNNFTILIVTAIAAAAFGRLSSIPLTLAGGLVLGVTMSLFDGYANELLGEFWRTVVILGVIGTIAGVAVVANKYRVARTIPWTAAGAAAFSVMFLLVAGVTRFTFDNNLANTLKSGIRPGIPFLFLFGLLVFSPSLRNKRDVADPLAGVDPPPPALAVAQLDTGLRKLQRGVFIGFLVFIAAFVLWQPSPDFRGQPLLGWTGSTWVSLMTQVVVFATIFLAITAFTGLSGQVTLATATFAGIGCYFTGQAVSNHGWPLLLAMVVAAFVAAILGAVLAIPALRLGGIFLTLATLAFGLLFSNVIFPLDGVSGGTSPVGVKEQSFFANVNLGFTTLDRGQSLFFFCFLFFAIAGFVVILVREGTVGRFMAALRGSEVASASIGINGTTARIILFAVSSFIAGLGGGLRATYEAPTGLPTKEFEALLGIVFLVLVLNTAPRTVDGAVNAAFGFIVFLSFLAEQLGIPAGVGIILFGLGAITYSRHPEGVGEFQKRRSLLRTIERREMARREKELRDADALPSQVAPVGRTVLLSVATLGVYSTYLTYRWYQQIRRERGIGLDGIYGTVFIYIPLRIAGALVLFGVLTDDARKSFFSVPWQGGNWVDWVVVLGAIGFVAPFNLTAFLLPRALSRMAEERGLVPGIKWTAGFGVVVPGLVLLLGSGQDESSLVNGSLVSRIGITYFAIFVLILLGAGAFISWISGMQQAMNAYFIDKAETAAGNVTPTAEAEAELAVHTVDVFTEPKIAPEAAT
ncbi:MAG: ABC transporter permease [Acidimicrobiia bacterium]